VGINGGLVRSHMLEDQRIVCPQPSIRNELRLKDLQLSSVTHGATRVAFQLILSDFEGEVPSALRPLFLRSTTTGQRATGIGATTLTRICLRQKPKNAE
jgi:hypothetical protein